MIDMDVIFGKIPVLNALENTKKPKVVYLLNTSPDNKIRYTCEKNSVRYDLAPKQVLEKYAGKGMKTQGVVALIDPYEYKDLDEELDKALKKKNPLVLMLDEIQDPVNFGSAIRSSAAFGVDFIIVGKNRQVGVTPTVVKISTGGSEYVPIVQVTNLSRTLDELKEKGFWTVGAAGEGDRYYDEVDYNGPICLVIGNEGKGISMMLKKRCDFIAKIPMTTNITSLNAAVATAVFLAGIVSYRRKNSAE